MKASQITLLGGDVLVTNTIPRSDRKGREGLFHIRVKAGVVPGIRGKQEPFRVELTRFSPKRGRVLDVLEVDSDDGL